MSEDAPRAQDVASARAPRLKTNKTGSEVRTHNASKSGASGYVYKIGEARDNLPLIVSEVGSEMTPSVIVGSRGKPTIVCVSYERFKPLLVHGNRAEKLAFVVVEELLADAPAHIRTPAVEELGRLSISDLECLLGIDAFPLSAQRMAALKRGMKEPSALDRLATRARVAQVLQEAREAGLYESLADATSGAVDEGD